MLCIRHSRWIILSFSVAIVVSYFFIDLPLNAFFSEPPSFWGQIAYVCNGLMDPVPNVLVWPLVFYVVYFLVGKEKAGRKILFIALVVNGMNAISIPLKVLLGRYRPEMWFSQNLYGFEFFSTNNLEMSFPSGHAITISAIWMALACLYPKRLPVFLLCSVLMSFSRVVVHAHYLSDILASILLSFIVSQLIYSSMQKKSGLFKPFFS